MLKKFYIKKEFFIQNKDSNIKDHYDFQQILGRGSFGIVYKSKMKYYPYSLRAIKRIAKKYVKNPADILKQYTVLTSLDHPQIIKIYQTYEDEQNFFIVLDYCEGGELFNRLAKMGTFMEAQAREIFIQMVNIIKYCHANNVAHRDLKPENFMLVSSKKLDLMLIDFGLCFRWKSDLRAQLQRRQGKGLLVGTAYYMCPQIFDGTYDQRCDIWSLGIILFMMLTGEPPVDGTTNEQILMNIRANKLNLKILNQKNLSVESINLILKILVKQEDRISLRDIISHPWISLRMPERALNINFQKIRCYSKFSKFKVLVLNYIASQLSQKEIMILGKIFLQIDKNKDGYLTVQELSDYFKDHTQQPKFEDISNIIKFMDLDHNGRLAYNQFISACLSKSASNNKDYLRFAFNYFDLNHDGKISRDELTIILRAYKKEYEDNYILSDKLMEECDLNKDNKIDFQQFCKYIIQKKPQ